MTTINNIIFTHGANKKPAVSETLENSLSHIAGLSGECFFGYPLLATPDGKFSIDAVLVSPEKGLVLFDLVEGAALGNYRSRQDDIYNKTEALLKNHKELLSGRKLRIQLTVVTFASIIVDINSSADEEYPVVNSEASLADFVSNVMWPEKDNEIYMKTLSAIESLSTIRKSRFKRVITRDDSRGAKLKALEDSIATLDHRQNKAVIETVDGVQRIRGLAGSGKTIVLALKAAYLHTQFPDWRIAVTFKTRSLKGQFKRLINNFCIEQTGEEPDWTKLRVVNSWGAPGDEERDGIYYEFCYVTGCEYLDFSSAKIKYGANDAFDGVCEEAMNAANKIPKLYDAILVDEAQDFAPSFLRMCYEMLKQPKRLIYAYDELQNLSGLAVLPPEEIFGVNAQGKPRVSLASDPRKDVILQKCYRNSRPILVAAHALGFGIFRSKPKGTATGIVQMFDQPALWTEIGYRVAGGKLAKGEHVILERSNETSPQFLEEHSPKEDLVVFKEMNNEDEQNQWLINAIIKNIKCDELRCDDIIVIDPNPILARKRCAIIRRMLFDNGIQSHHAGVDTAADVFFKTGAQSITFTGIYRAKGNEAGMVYIINAQDCDGTGTGLATARNRLFTSITRSKAWVRVVGFVDGMRNLCDEFNKLIDHDFTLDFDYPSDLLLKKLRIVHRDLSLTERKRLEAKLDIASQLVDALERGELAPEDLAETREKLLSLLGNE
jgi:superfamily I DNA and RNA helicase